MQSTQMKNEYSGFSLIEVLTSVFVVSISLVTIMQLTTQGLRETLDSRDQLIASGLAQEGIEKVRSTKNSTWQTYGGSSLALVNISAGTDEHFCVNNSDSVNVYGSCPTAEGGFYRKVSVSMAPDGINKEIISMVTWSGNPIGSMATVDCNLANKCFFTEATITDWIN